MAGVDTVRGWVSADDLGITLMHEHVFCDASVWFSEPSQSIKRPLVDAPVSMNNLGLIRRDPFVSKDNLRLNDVQLAVKELSELKELGAATIVDRTPSSDKARNPAGLKQVSQETGLNIVASTGWYTAASHPEFVKEKTIDELRDVMIAELTKGIGQTGIKAGTIKVGCSEPIPYHQQELKVLRAAARAQKETGVSLTIHPSLFDTTNKTYPNGVAVAENYLRVLKQEGADVSKFSLSHSDWLLRTNEEQYIKLLKDGITLSFDTFGEEQFFESMWYGARSPADLERVEMVASLCKKGYDHQIVLSQDVYEKIELKTYGGMGYTHLLLHIVPWMKHVGVSNDQVRNMLVENPRRILSY